MGFTVCCVKFLTIDFAWRSIDWFAMPTSGWLTISFLGFRWSNSSGSRCVCVILLCHILARFLMESLPKKFKQWSSVHFNEAAWVHTSYINTINLRTEINSIACQFPDQKYEPFYTFRSRKVFSLKLSNGGKFGRNAGEKLASPAGLSECKMLFYCQQAKLFQKHSEDESQRESAKNICTLYIFFK